MGGTKAPQKAVTKKKQTPGAWQGSGGFAGNRITRPTQMDYSTDLRTSLIQIAKKAAGKSRSSLADFFGRPASRTFLLRRATELQLGAEETLRAAIAALREEISRSPNAEWKEPIWDNTKKRRPPTRGHEPLESLVWPHRVAELATLLDSTSQTTDDLIMLTKKRLGWSARFFSSVIAAADGRGIMMYVHPHWMWANGEMTHQDIVTAWVAENERVANAGRRRTNQPRSGYELGHALSSRVEGQEDESSEDHSTD